LEQYKEGLIQVVLSEIVFRELNVMLVAKAKEVHDAVSKALKEGLSNSQFTGDQKAAMERLHGEMIAPEEHAKKQLKQFVEATGAHIVPAEKAAMKAILTAYFKREPPFSNKGKKNEFSDAISLLSLEAWAREHGKRVLAVSNDTDWKAFADASEFVDCIDDLGKAMQTLADAATAAEPDARKILDAIRANDPVALREAFDRGIRRAVESESPYVEFDGPMPGEEEGVSLSLVEYRIPDLEPGLDELTIVRISADGFVMRVPIHLKVSATVDISFAVYDSVDKDYVPMGSTSVEQEVEFDAHALIDCRRIDPVEGISVDYEIEDAQLVGTPSSIDIGYVDYSMADDYEDLDPEDWNGPADVPEQQDKSAF